MTTMDVLWVAAGFFVVFILVGLWKCCRRCCHRRKSSGTNRDVEAQKDRQQFLPTQKSFTHQPHASRFEHGVDSEQLDLHGYSATRAEDKVQDYLQRKKNEYRRGGSRYCDIITGRGRHSKGGVPVIKPLVEEFLHNNDYSFYPVNEGMLRVDLSN